jgi:hypothetical protein
MRPGRVKKDLAGAEHCPEKGKWWPTGQVGTGDAAPDASYVL